MVKVIAVAVVGVSIVIAASILGLSLTRRTASVPKLDLASFSRQDSRQFGPAQIVTGGFFNVFGVKTEYVYIYPVVFREIDGQPHFVYQIEETTYSAAVDASIPYPSHNSCINLEDLLANQTYNPTYSLRLIHTTSDLEPQKINQYCKSLSKCGDVEKCVNYFTTIETIDPSHEVRKAIENGNRVFMEQQLRIVGIDLL